MKEFNAWVNFLTKPWVLLVYCAVIVLSYFYWDIAIANYFHALKLRQQWPVLFVITNLGKGQYYLLALVILVLIFRYIWKNKLWEDRSLFLLICVAVPDFICIIAKEMLGRARPTLLFHQHLYGFFGWHVERSYWSFPSGHTTTIISLMVGGMIIWPRYRHVFLLISIIVMLSRILLTDHYVSDVLSTALLTILELSVVFYFMRKLPQNFGVKRFMNA